MSKIKPIGNLNFKSLPIKNLGRIKTKECNWCLHGINPDKPDKICSICYDKFKAMLRSNKWNITRKSILSIYFNCKVCNSISSLIIDHIKPWIEFPDLFWDGTNLQVLCAHCHQLKTISENPTTSFG